MPSRFCRSEEMDKIGRVLQLHDLGGPPRTYPHAPTRPPQGSAGSQEKRGAMEPTALQLPPSTIPSGPTSPRASRRKVQGHTGVTSPKLLMALRS
ncbi:uncharacterized protein SPSK_02862 [Sporothrix schenckii 1099-18]|uniref:Uncharacterized protein n=1 Tax=Sporothrix schenckii 1099-18 TaxID=1397361 RepID=A0A0F2ME40_SPOSC|nr:uncharacterized protein SPSK_02862 [Sporothrix schenckii 1099-18]KJR86421.1 hypothetical protein SPSK_02862 [Sporothrix schenckii 1099-18]